MKVVGLISGGKDSIFNLLHCIAAGHEIVAVANIEPYKKEELDSFMYQSVGHEAIALIATALGLPIFRQTTKGNAMCKDKTYTESEEDEVEDMLELLSKVKKSISIEAVAVGAIASDYQRTRVENVCERLGLKCLAYLWKRDQKELLQEMINCGLDAIIVKIAGMGLKPEYHLGAHIGDIKNNLFELHKKYGINICGEGGEYETITLDCPLFTKVIEIIEYEVTVPSNDPFAPVGILNVKNAVLKTKTGEKKDPVLFQMTRTNYIQQHINNPFYFVQDCLIDAAEMLLSSEVSQNLRSSRPSRILPTVKSKSVLKVSSSIKTIQTDRAICQLNYSTGWFFVGNATGPNLAHTLSTIQKHLMKTEFDFRDIVLVELFVRDLAEFSSMNNTYSLFMPKVSPPVRVCVETCLPPDVGVLLNLIAHKCISKSQKATGGCSAVDREVLHVQSISHWAPANIGPYSQCIRVGPVYFIAGQIPLIPGNMELLNESVFSQCSLTLRHVLRIMKATTESLSYSNILQAICYVTSESTAEIIVPMFTYITDNKNATVTSIVVTELPKKAELEWQVLACDLDNPEVTEETEIVGDYKVYMKRCIFKGSPVSSLLCTVSNVKKKHKSDTSLKKESVENLISILNNGVRFLNEDPQRSGVPFCMLKLFYKMDETMIGNIISEITKFKGNCKVTAAGIPVLGFEDPDVFLTVTGHCH